MESEHLRLETPERVALELEIVGLGPRVLAFVVDAGILFLFWITVVFLLGMLTHGDALGWYGGLSDLLRTLLLLSIFAVNWGYGLFFEWLWHGQTPGKRLLGLRVVRRDGRPYDLATSAVRNLTRVIDGLPLGTYAVGLTVVVASEAHRRLGDLLAGTVLVRDVAPDLSVYDAAPIEDAEGEGAAARPLPAAVYETVVGYLERRVHLAAEAREPIARATLRIVLGAAPAAEREREGARLAGAGLAEIDAYLSARVAATRSPRTAGRMAPGDVVAFVQRRRRAWEGLAAALDRLESGQARLEDLDALDRLYRESARDLAWVQTRHPGSIAARFLEGLCARAYREVYRSRGVRWSRIAIFYARDFPRAVVEALPSVHLAFFLLALGGLGGALLTILDPAVADDVLGPRVMETVRSGRVWTDSLVSVAPPSLVSARIFTNNLSVVALTFVGGLCAGVVTGALLLLNGALVGVALAATAEHGVAGRLLDFAAAHGPVELSLLVLAGAAGLQIAAAILAPGSLGRGDALRVGGRRGGQILLGSAPLLVGVGLIEGYLSPGTIFPTWLKAGLGLGLGLLLWVYLLRYGRRAQRAQATPASSEASLPPAW